MRREVSRELAGGYTLTIALQSTTVVAHSIMTDAIRDVDHTLNIVADNVARQLQLIAADKVAETVVDKSKVS